MSGYENRSGPKRNRSGSDNRRRQLQKGVRFTEEEHTIISYAANQKGISFAGYVRESAILRALNYPSWVFSRQDGSLREIPITKEALDQLKEAKYGAQTASGDSPSGAP